MAANYFQLYGVEPFASLGVPLATDYGGGAKVTNDNFLITLWNVTQSAGPIPVAGDRIKPVWETVGGAQEVQDLYGPGYTKNSFNSRLSTRFLLSGLNPLVGSLILATLQAPKQDFLLQSEPASLNPSSPIGVFINLQTNPLLIACMDVEIHQPVGILLPAVSGAPISDVPVNLTGVGPSFFLRTNGSDGVFPEFYDLSTPAAAVESINQVKKGAPIYLGAIIGPAVGYDTLDVLLRWPHSSGRG